MLSLAGLTDSSVHDGRVLIEDKPVKVALDYPKQS
jgi:hypothetical protein